MHIHLSVKFLLSTYYVLNILLGSRDIAMNKLGKNPALKESLCCLQPSLYCHIPTQV